MPLLLTLTPELVAHLFTRAGAVLRGMCVCRTLCQALPRQPGLALYGIEILPDEADDVNAEDVRACLARFARSADFTLGVSHAKVAVRGSLREQLFKVATHSRIMAGVDAVLARGTLQLLVELSVDAEVNIPSITAAVCASSGTLQRFRIMNVPARAESLAGLRDALTGCARLKLLHVKVLKAERAGRCVREGWLPLVAAVAAQCPLVSSLHLLKFSTDPAVIAGLADAIRASGRRRLRLDVTGTFNPRNYADSTALLQVIDLLYELSGYVSLDAASDGRLLRALPRAQDLRLLGVTVSAGWHANEACRIGDIERVCAQRHCALMLGTYE